MAIFEPSISLVHADMRGEIYSISLPDNRELMLLHSKAGTVRGGHSHDVPESVLVLTGKLNYQKLGADGTTKIEALKDGEYSQNDAREVHMGFFPEDTWILEWKVCHDKYSWKNTDYEPWRERVRTNASTISNSS